MENEQITHDLLLKFKGFKNKVKMHLTDTKFLKQFNQH